MNIVIDKSFLDGASTEQVHYLCKKENVLFTEQLLYELMTTCDKSRKRCFSKFPAILNPVKLMPNVGMLLGYELEKGISCTPLEQHVIVGDFQFNSKLRHGVYVPDVGVFQTTKEWEAQVKKDTEDFLIRCGIVHQFFPELNGIEYKNLQSGIDNARKRIAEDYNFVRSIYKSFLEGRAYPSNAPSPELIGPDWAIFRWIQCQILSALRMFGKFQGRIENPVSENVFTRAEHTMHDIYYTVHATLSGALAAMDQEVMDDFQLLCPKGVLVVKT